MAKSLIKNMKSSFEKLMEKLGKIGKKIFWYHEKKRYSKLYSQLSFFFYDLSFQVEKRHHSLELQKSYLKISGPVELQRRAVYRENRRAEEGESRFEEEEQLE